MKKNLSYRDKLLELASIYKISEVQNYIKRKKNLKIIGPEIIDLFENSTDWEYIVSKLNKVIV